MTSVDDRPQAAPPGVRLAARLAALQRERDRHHPPALRALAELRRARGGSIDDTVAVMRLYGLLGHSQGAAPAPAQFNARQLEDLMLAAWLVASSRVRVWVPGAEEQAQPRRFGGFGADMRVLRYANSDERSGLTGPDRLMRMILASDRADLPRHLRRAFALLDSHQTGENAQPVTVNVAELVRDLGDWDKSARRRRSDAVLQSSPERGVQRAWAHGYWGFSLSTSAPDGAEDTTTITSIEGDR